jgi:hypothetical protein
MVHSWHLLEKKLQQQQNKQTNKQKLKKLARVAQLVCALS